MNHETKRSIEISSLTVSIQTLRIGGKSMSAAIFKQLPYSQYVNEHAIVWGYVSYEYRDLHFWLLWTMDGADPQVDGPNTLRRTPVEREHIEHIKKSFPQLFIQA